MPATDFHFIIFAYECYLAGCRQLFRHYADDISTLVLLLLPPCRHYRLFSLFALARRY